MWLAKWTNPTVPSNDLILLFQDKLFTTHSFSFEKITPDGDVIPYETIFSNSDKNGILSNGYRKKVSINEDDNSTSRNIPTGLENYVFAYLGIHQPYYARKQDDQLGIHAKPFGIYLKNPTQHPLAERYPFNHASRRDIGSPEVLTPSEEYLHSDKARHLMAYQVVNDPDHEKDDETSSFWHYYGDVQNWKQGDYANNSWGKKAEFRFFEKLDLDCISAVLWPIWIENIKNDGDFELSKTHADLNRYTTAFPDIKFITYSLDLADPEICFVEASCVALKYFLKTGIFPDNIETAKDILGL
jgi:hypothetical protein